jgi:hypothetical protein
MKRILLLLLHCKSARNAGQRRLPARRLRRSLVAAGLRGSDPRGKIGFVKIWNLPILIYEFTEVAVLKGDMAIVFCEKFLLTNGVKPIIISSFQG